MTKEEKAKLDNRRGSWRAKLQAQKDAHKGIIAKPESEDERKSILWMLMGPQRHWLRRQE